MGRGVRGTVLAPGHGDVAVDAARSSAAHALSLDLARISDRGWEDLAGDIESGRQLWLAVLDVRTGLPQVRVLAESVLAAWRRVGLPATALSSLTVTALPGLDTLTPARATQALTRLAQAADALDQVRADG